MNIESERYEQCHGSLGSDVNLYLEMRELFIVLLENFNGEHHWKCNSWAAVNTDTNKHTTKWTQTCAHKHVHTNTDTCTKTHITRNKHRSTNTYNVQTQTWIKSSPANLASIKQITLHPITPHPVRLTSSN